MALFERRKGWWIVVNRRLYSASTLFYVLGIFGLCRTIYYLYELQSREFSYLSSLSSIRNSIVMLIAVIVVFIMNAIWGWWGRDIRVQFKKVPPQGIFRRAGSRQLYRKSSEGDIERAYQVKGRWVMEDEKLDAPTGEEVVEFIDFGPN